MSDSENICPKCKGRMQGGFIVDNTYGGRMVSKWIEDAPEKKSLAWRETERQEGD